MTTTPPLIEARDAGFSYAQTEYQQVENLTFTLHHGKRMAIMGATGAGKSTLAMMLNGLIPHHHDGQFAGEIRINGLETTETPVSDLVRQVGMVMQDAEAQITARRALDDVAVGPANLGLERAEVWKRAKNAMQTVGLADLADRDTSQMSGGQQQRLAIAGILAMQPDLLVLDEPTSELDPEGSSTVYEVINTLNRSAGQTVVLIDHDPDRVLAWADILLVLHKGRAVYWGPPTPFLADRELVTSVGLRQPGVLAALGSLVEANMVPQPTDLPTDVTSAAALLLPHVKEPRACPANTAKAPPTQTDTIPAINVTSLTHIYPSGIEALSGITLKINQGEFVALLGQNGAGKTTFARHLNNLLRPTSGDVQINGISTADRKVHELSSEVGYVFQNPDHQIFAATVHEEIAFGLHNLNIPNNEIKDRVVEVLQRVKLPGVSEVPPFTLGRGERQRVAVASVLALRPRILVIDEPTTGQDWAGSVSMLELVKELNQQGHTILIITHDMALAAQYAHRALVFEKSRLAADLPITQLFSDLNTARELHLELPPLTDLALRLGLPPVSSAESFATAWRRHNAA